MADLWCLCVYMHWVYSNIVTQAGGFNSYKVLFQRKEQKNRTLFCQPNFKVLNMKVSCKNYWSVLQFFSISRNQFRNFKQIWSYWVEWRIKLLFNFSLWIFRIYVFPTLSWNQLDTSRNFHPQFTTFIHYS